MTKAPKPKAGIIDRAVGQRIRLRRVLCGLSASHLARQIGVSYQQISKYETGKDRVPASNLYRIAKLLDTTTDYYFMDIDDTGPS